MKRRGTVMLVSAGVLGLAAALAGRYTMPGPIYMAGEVEGALQRQPGQWAGRTVLVRGVMMGGATMNVCTSTDVASGALCTQQQSWTIGSTGAGGWVSVSTTILGGRPRGANRGGSATATAKVTSIPLYVSRASLPAQELVVASLHGVRPLASGARLVLPDATYTLPVVGPLAARFFPRDGSEVYRVRLLDPRICAQVTQPPCADTVFAR